MRLGCRAFAAYHLIEHSGRTVALTAREGGRLVLALIVMRRPHGDCEAVQVAERCDKRSRPVVAEAAPAARRKNGFAVEFVLLPSIL